MECRINTDKLEEFIGTDIEVSLDYNALYVKKGYGEKLVEYLELVGVIGKILEDSYEDIVEIKNGDLYRESFGNALLGDGSIKPSFTISIDEDKRII